MAERIFDFLTYHNATEGKGRNGFKVNLTSEVRDDPSILGEFLQYAIGNDNRRISQKIAADLYPITISFQSSKPKEQSTLLKAATILATEIVKSDQESRIESIYVEEDFRTPDPVEE